MRVSPRSRLSVLGACVAAAFASLAVAAQALPAGTVTFFSAGISPKSHPSAIVSGPDGNLWFTEEEGNRVARITPSGTVTEFSAGITPASFPLGITAGPDGNLWFTEASGSRIGRITPSGAVTEFSTGITAHSEPLGITAGPDGNLWFTERAADKIGRITPEGVVTEFSTGLSANAHPTEITAGPDGNVWFTELTIGQIGRITPEGVVTEFSKGMTAGSEPIGIAQGPEGNLWFAAINGSAGEYGLVTPLGAITESKSLVSTDGIAPGADGNMWQAEPAEHLVVHIPPGGVAGTFPVAAGHGFSEGLTAGPDGNEWFTSAGGEVGRITTGAPEALIAATTQSGRAQAGSPEQCVAAVWETWAGRQPSASLFGFDGYRWLRDGTQIASGPSYTPTSSDVGHALSCMETVTYPLLGVSESSTSAAATVVAAPVIAPVARVAPVLSGVSESAPRWREGGKLASITRRRPPIGTTFRFTLNEAATVTLTFTQSRAGRLVHGKCAAPTHANRRKRSCGRRVAVATITLSAHAGTDSIRFQGRISRSRKLALGNYTLLISALSSAGLGTQAPALRFAIVR